MLADYFEQKPEDEAATLGRRVWGKTGQAAFYQRAGPKMRVLIVVDKLLTGLMPLPPTSISTRRWLITTCPPKPSLSVQVDRLDGDDKEYGYIIDYKDLFKSLENGQRLYGRGLAGCDKEGMWPGCSRIDWPRPKRIWITLWEAVRALCEPVKA